MKNISGQSAKLSKRYDVVAFDNFLLEKQFLEKTYFRSLV